MNKTVEQTKEAPEQPEKKPNENAGFYFSSSIKIFDPETQEILVQTRGDD